MFKIRQADHNRIRPKDLLIRILTLFSGSQRYFTEDMLIDDAVNEDFDEYQFGMALGAFELTLGVDIPVEMTELAKLSGMTVGEFARAAARLPKTGDCLQIARFVLLTGYTIRELAPDDSYQQ